MDNIPLMDMHHRLTNRPRSFKNLPCINPLPLIDHILQTPPVTPLLHYKQHILVHFPHLPHRFIIFVLLIFRQQLLLNRNHLIIDHLDDIWVVRKTPQNLRLLPNYHIMPLYVLILY